MIVGFDFWMMNAFFPFLKSTTLLLQCQLILQCPLQWNLKRWRIKHCRQHFLKTKCTFFYSYIQGFPTRSEWWSELSCWCCAGWWCLDSARHSILHYGTSICKLFPVYFAYAVSMSLGQVTFSRCIVTHWTPVALPKCIGTPLSPFRRKTITGLLSFCRINPHLWDFTRLLVMF